MLLQCFVLCSWTGRYLRQVVLQHAVQRQQRPVRARVGLAGVEGRQHVVDDRVYVRGRGWYLRQVVLQHAVQRQQRPVRARVGLAGVEGRQHVVDDRVYVRGRGGTCARWCCSTRCSASSARCARGLGSRASKAGSTLLMTVFMFVDGVVVLQHAVQRQQRPVRARVGLAGVEGRQHVVDDRVYVRGRGGTCARWCCSTRCSASSARCARGLGSRASKAGSTLLMTVFMFVDGVVPAPGGAAARGAAPAAPGARAGWARGRRRPAARC
ncbi:hypothetical protein ACJJTC_012091 [Scirpophaga incertulas]